LEEIIILIIKIEKVRSIRFTGGTKDGGSGRYRDHWIISLIINS
jgi:hypothetical protein